MFEAKGQQQSVEEGVRDDSEVVAQIQPNELISNPRYSPLGIIKWIEGSVIIAEPNLEMTKHIKPLYALLDGQPIPRVLVNNEAIVNIHLARMLKRLCKDETYLILT